MAHKFRFIITDTFAGVIKGTDDEKRAHEFAECEEFFVYDTQEGVWLSMLAGRVEIQDVEKPD